VKVGFRPSLNCFCSTRWDFSLKLYSRTRGLTKVPNYLHPALVWQADPRFARAVTTTDIEIPVKPRSFGTAVLASTGEPALQLDTVLCTIFAPANAHKQGSGKQQQWLQRPLGQTSAGFARFVNKPQWMLRIAFLLFAARTKLPAEIDVPLADRLADVKGDGLKKENIGEQEMRERSGKDEAGVGTSSMSTLVDEEGNRFPLIIFSHGLGGGRTTYR
jgi:platelet-activating factor acetylhydrolase